MSICKKIQYCLCGTVLAAAMLTGMPAAVSAEEVRTIHLRQDDAQVRFDSKVYELKYVKAEEILPFVKSAVLRYNRNSAVRRVTTEDGTKEALLVSTGSDFLSGVDAIIAALDRPGKSGQGSVITGTGITRIAYEPEYRAAADFANIINTAVSSDSGAAFVNQETNTVYWRDQDAAAKRTLQFVKLLDRPIPQVNVRLNYYEIRDSDLKDWGFDYLAWKNGPGVNMLNVGYDAGKVVLDEIINQVPYAFSTTWGLGGIFTAPQFDMSFIRCLQQSGNANAAASASLIMVNTPVGSETDYALLKEVQDKYPSGAPFIYSVSMQPEYQNIQKNILGRSFIGKSFYEDDDGNYHADPPSLEAKIVNPFVCMPTAPGREPVKDVKAGGVLFDYSLYFKSVVERGNTGAELQNNALIGGSTSLAFDQEKVLAVYEKENDVEQTIGIPVLCRIPYIKYLFSTVTTIKERTYIVITAEVNMAESGHYDETNPKSASGRVERRIENPFRSSEKKD